MTSSLSTSHEGFLGHIGHRGGCNGICTNLQCWRPEWGGVGGPGPSLDGVTFLSFTLLPHCRGAAFPRPWGDADTCSLAECPVPTLCPCPDMKWTAGGGFEGVSSETPLQLRLLELEAPADLVAASPKAPSCICPCDLSTMPGTAVRADQHLGWSGAGGWCSGQHGTQMPSVALVGTWLAQIGL